MDKAAVISMVCAARIEYLAVERDEWRTLWPMPKPRNETTIWKRIKLSKATCGSFKKVISL